VDKYYRVTVEILSATVKHVRPHLRSIQIKFEKQGKSHFSRPSALEAIIPREILRLEYWKRFDGDRMAVPSQIHRARSKIANII